MKRILLIIISSVVLLTIQCSSPNKESESVSGKSLNKQLPRVLFITTGISSQNIMLSQGITVAIQTLNKKGALVRLEPRDILYNYKSLSNYNIIILSTAKDYHDADRDYSLTYMSDEELENLRKFVSNGGVLICGDNVGRNLLDGTDRISIARQLNPESYKLSECFGVTLSEKNMAGYTIEGKIGNSFSVEMPPATENELWTLVSDSIISKHLKILASWKNTKKSFPAIIQNKYNKGMAYLLASSGFLHPVNDGGYWSIDQIQRFYEYVLDEFYKENNIQVHLNPWPNACDYAFCCTFNSLGKLDQYKRVLNFLKREDIQPTLFVNGLVNDTIKTYINSKEIPLASSGYSYFNYKDLKYPASINDILRNENYWNKKFTGFRFPYTTPGYWGLLALDLQNYSFESSISANNIDFLNGSVFPYNIVIANDKFYKSTNILEIGSTYHDDYYFLQALIEKNNVDENQLTKDVMIYNEYLQDFWENAVKPYNGLMVYLGHPGLVGYNDTTLSALKNLVSKIKKDNTWVTTISEVATYWKNMENFQFIVNGNDEKQKIEVIGPSDIIIKNVTLNIKTKPQKVHAQKGKVKIKENAQGYGIIFDAINGQIITISK